MTRGTVSGGLQLGSEETASDGSEVQIVKHYESDARCKFDVFKGNGRVIVRLGSGTRVDCRHIAAFHDHELKIGADGVVRGLALLLRGPSVAIRIGDRFACGSLQLNAYGANIIIGNDVLISTNVQFRTYDMHAIVDATSGEQINNPKPIIVEDHVWIGEGARIMPGVTIGRDSIIGIGSIVTRDVPRNSVAAGVPARVVRSGVS